MVWLPAGFLIACLLLIPTVDWLKVAPLVVGASILVGFDPRRPWFDVLVAAAATPMAMMLATAVLRRWIGKEDALLVRASNPWRVLAAATLAALFAGLIHVVQDAFTGKSHFMEEGQAWFGSTLIGVLLTYPLVLGLAAMVRRGHPIRRAYSLEFLGLLAASAVLSALLFVREESIADAFWPAPYLLFPLFIWGALRLGTVGAASSLFVVGVLAAAATPGNLGPIALLADTEEMRLLLLQTFLLVSGMTSLLLASATEQSARALDDVVSAEERYRTIFESASDAIFVGSQDGKCLDANQAASTLTGFGRESLLGRRAEDLVDLEELRVRPSQQHLALEGTPFLSERTLIRADGSRVEVEFNVKPLPDGRIIAVCRDLSLRRGHERALQAVVSGTSIHVGEAFFSHLVESLARALGVKWAMAAELVEAEPGTARMLALWADGAPGETKTYRLEGTPCEKSVADSVCYCPERVQQYYPEDTALAEMGAESYLGLAIRDRYGRTIGHLAVLDDKRLEVAEPMESILRIFAARAGAEIERLRSESALRQSEARQRALIESFPDTLFVMTVEGVYVSYHCHEPERLRVPPQQFIGKSYRDVMPAELHPRFDRAFESLRAGRNPEVFEYESVDRNQVRHYEVRHSLVGEGLVLAILRDVTGRKAYDAEIKKLNERLEREVEQRTAQLAAANRELESFAYSVSHDLRAPLRGIHANASILQEDLGTRLSGEDRETLNRIISRATEMSNLIDGLLKISRIMRAELQREEVDLTALAREAFDSVARWHPNRQIKVAIAPSLHALGDRVLLLSALTNLFDNALKFTVHESETRIEFGAKEQGHEMVFFVSDNGVGFNMEHAGKLFRPFERLHTVDEFAGTGIGLATVHRVVQRHGGRIWAEGGVGKGATFYFTLPSEYPSSATEAPPGE